MADSPTKRDATALPTPAAKKLPSTLLPAFEPLSSSPALPRPLKRTRDALDEPSTYPTPVPTSSTAILTSSPIRAQAPRPITSRTLSTSSERPPLASVPSLQLPSDGQPIRLGRSSASCDLQLSANRIISRVHVVAWYRPAPSTMELDRVYIKCIGWNTMTVHSGGKVFELRKDQDFSTDIRDTEILVDVHGSRVRIHWPEKQHLGPVSSDEDEEEGSPSKRRRGMMRHSTPPSPSPAQTRRRPVSPVSPSPAVQALLPSSPPLLPRDPPIDPRTTPPIDIYEDPESADENPPGNNADDPSQAATQIQTQSMTDSTNLRDCLASPGAAISDNDEENDPIIISFGPSGHNLLPRMASFNTGSPSQRNRSPETSRSSHIEPLQPSRSSAQPSNEVTTEEQDLDIKEHIINQLAFSRLSSTPLSTILGNLPRDAGTPTVAALQEIINEVECIGRFDREGKDAAGKRLESEYYYIPDKDEDEKRKEAVVTDLMKPGLRACRKQHKQYYWRKPK